MVGLLSLPEEALELIAAKTATRMSWYEENWRGAAASCKRLHNVQLPDECVIVQGIQSLPWLVPRLKHAKALRITSRSTFNPLSVRLPQNEIANRLQRASCNLPGLQVLALRLGMNSELVNFAPGKGEGIALPQGCALRLYAPATPIQRWSESGVAGREAVTAMCVWPTDNPVGHPWPEGLANFTGLQLLELNCLHMKEALDLSVVCHIPCVKICSRDRMAAHIPKGSWQLLELEGRRWKVTFADVHSFVRSVSVFAFTFPSACTQFAVQLAKACHRASVPLRKQQHTRQAEMFSGDAPGSSLQITKLSNNEQFVGGALSDSAVLLGVWQADPVKSAFTGLKPFQ
ncbi:g8658 [Coccomyxa viridis]|uniref:G8658 protein n=1 Tax=Coccomyxa viridis TaxID=1274662 RepID=A0ABP1G5E2_9CHLO